MRAYRARAIANAIDRRRRQHAIKRCEQRGHELVAGAVYRYCKNCPYFVRIR